jgi:hypothetical protein
VTPFTVLGLLREIESNNGFDAESKKELVGTISRLEQHYFLDQDRQTSDAPELSGVARDWVNRAVGAPVA